MKGVVERALAILSSFTSDSPALTLSEISRITGLPVATVHRLVSTLVLADYLVRDQDSGRYRIGVATYRLGMLYIPGAGLHLVSSILDFVGDLTRERVALHALAGQYSIAVASVESPQLIRYTEPLGSRSLAYSTANGKVLLSEMSALEICELYPSEDLRTLTSATISKRSKLLLELEQVRTCGIAVSRDEYTSGLTAIAAPVRNARGQIVAAISVAGPSLTIDDRKLSNLGSLVKYAGLLASSTIGYRGPSVTCPSLEEIRSWWTSVENASN